MTMLGFDAPDVPHHSVRVMAAMEGVSIRTWMMRAVRHEIERCGGDISLDDLDEEKPQ